MSENKNVKAYICFFTAIICFAYFLIMEFLNPAIIAFHFLWGIAGLFFMSAGLFLKSKKKKIISKKVKTVFYILFGLAFLTAAFNLYRINSFETLEEECEYVIILGGGIKSDGTLTSMPMERIKTAASYLEKYPDAKAIVTGGTLPPLKYSEAPELKNQLEKLGIKSERILAEDKALDTIENFKYSIKLIQQDSRCSQEEVMDKKIAVVTSSFHLSRAKKISALLGLKNICLVEAKVPFIFIPNVYAREICSWLKLDLRILYNKASSGGKKLL